jgi:hypothetical protein
MTNNTEDWSIFYTSEIALFDYLRSNSDCRYSESTLTYDEFLGDYGGVLTKPKRYIRWIGVLNDDPREFVELVKEMEKNYQKAMGSKFKRFPPRFPQLFNDIEEFNISTQNAFQSKLMPNSGMLVLKTHKVGAGDDDGMLKALFQSHVKALHSIGMVTAEYRISERYALFSTATVYELLIPMHNFISHYNCEAVQRRVNTGRQYKVRIKRAGELVRQQVTLGLMVLTKECKDLAITHSEPKAPRSNTLDEQGLRIELPFESNFQFYRRLNLPNL